MDDFKHGRKVLTFWAKTGEVLGSNKYSETHVSSSGGGGYVGSHGGYVRAPEVYSTVVVNHEFWIRTQEGKEVPIKLKGFDVPIRPGQWITVISAGLKDKESDVCSILINHNANLHWFVTNATALNRYFRLERVTLISLLYATILFFITIYATAPIQGYVRNYLLMDHVELALLIAGATIVFRIIRKFVRIRTLEKRLQSHLAQLAQEGYSKFRAR